jgi:hypothetical protein
MSERNLAFRPQVPRVVAIVMAFAVALTTLGACSDNPTKQDITGPSRAFANDASDEDDDGDVVYDQVEFLGNPLVSEVTIMKSNHDAYNRTQPYNTATFGPQSLAFINAFRGAQPVVANTLGAVLYPDMLVVESSRNPASAGWLSWALAAGWGGRKLADDVVDAGLSAIFGKIITATGAYCDNFTLPLCTDNVGANDKAFSNTFPYLAAPTN